MDRDYLKLDSLRNVLNNSGIGIWSFDVYSRTFTICDQIGRLTGGNVKDTAHVRTMMKLLSAAYLRKVYYAFYSGYHHHKPIAVEIRLNDSEQSENNWICLNGTFNPDSGNFNGLMYDISERKRNDISVSILVAKLGHELRSPLTTIRLYTQQSLKSARNNDPGIIPYLEIADRQINRVNFLIEDFMLASTSDFNSIRLNKTKFSIRELLSEVITESFPGAVSDRIIVRIEKDLDFFADREKIIQVLNNYISNALKYSQDDTRIIVRCREKNGEISLSVQDFGIGISTEEQNRIFQKYYRCKNVAGIRGYGIGLFIVREIIEAHQGTFGIKSRPAKGSIFHFSLPAIV